MRRILLLITFFCASLNLTYAQFSLKADFRARGEYRDGARILLSDSLEPTFVASQRTRLIADYKDDKFQIRIGLQNARIWGNDDERANIPNINLSEGWFKYALLPSLAAKVGRQHLVLDDGRIFGMRNWNDIAVSHDLAVLQYEKNDWNILAGGGYNNDGNDYTASPYNVKYYKYLVFLWVNRTFENGLQVSLLHSTDANEDKTDFTKTNKRNTVGLYSKYSSNSNFGFEGSAYYQYGKHTSGLDQSGYMFSLIPSYQLSEKVKLVAGTNYFSGNNQLDTTSTTNRSFNKLFGDGHRYYGLLDYFLNIEDNTDRTGVQELFAGVFIKTSEKSELEISYHHFATTGALIDTQSPKFKAADAELGSEIDLQYKHKVNSYFTVVLNYATMFATPSMEILKGGDHNRYQQWANLMLIAKPELFRSDKK
ncbi:hypothetical protein C9994_09465 [Marivirga lumbricoides]|uniref:Alginate export domain-containing protein n=1 Tax=Marivirga lumbricoides TaxID=1046115 RepID=A0A2T4DQ88_9BACT|nr:hypothetical protein C9994_09465 [Marivirga lumbricoides]